MVLNTYIAFIRRFYLSMGDYTSKIKIRAFLEAYMRRMGDLIHVFILDPYIY